MNWINSTQISIWAKEPGSKSNFPLLVSRLIRATAPLGTFFEFPRGVDTYSGGWDGIVSCKEATAYVPEGISLWELGTEAGIKKKADSDYKKRSKNPLNQIPAESTFVFVTTGRWTKKSEWVAAKKKEKVWKNVIAYDGVDLEQWLSDAPAVAWWLAVLSGNMPADGILSGEQSWADYAESPKYKLATQVLTCSRLEEGNTVRFFLTAPPASMTIKSRSRDEAIAFILAVGMELEEQAKQDFLARVLIVEDAKAFRTVANNRNGLILIAKFDDPQPIGTAVTKGHHVFLPLGGDDTHGAGPTIVLSQLGRELEQALTASGLSPEDARKYMVESGRDLTILRRLLDFPYSKIKWADPEFAALLLPALFLGRWEEKKEGDTALLQTLAGEPYTTYMEKLNRWQNDPNPFLYRIGSYWRLASPLDAWAILANHITEPQLVRFKTVALSVLGQVKPMFELEPHKRFMAAVYGKESIYSSSAREGVSQALILFALFATALRLPVGDSQQWVEDLIGELLQSDDPDLWRSLDDVMPLIGEAAPDRYLSSIYTSLVRETGVIMGTFQEDPSFLFPKSYYTGLLWALEALSWFPPYLQRTTAILAKLANNDPGGALSNRPINSLYAIFLPWIPMTYADRFERQAVLKALLEQNPDVSWALISSLLPAEHQHVPQSHQTRWRSFGVEHSNSVLLVIDIFDTYSMLYDLALPLAGMNEKRLTKLLESSINNLVRPTDRRRIIDHIASISGDIHQESYDIFNSISNLLYRHRKYSEQSWALPEDILNEYEPLLLLLKPKSPIEICRNLFEVGHPDLPEMAALDPMDFQAEEDLIRSTRINAVHEVHTKHGLDQVMELAGTVKEKRYFGEAMAYCLDAIDDQLKVILELGFTNSGDFNAAAGLVWTNANVKGIEWTKEVYTNLKQKNIVPKDLSRMLTWGPLSPDLYQFLEELDDEISMEYWMKNRPWIGALSDIEKVGAIEHLLTIGRGGTAVELVNLYSSQCSTDLIMRSLRGSVQDSVQNMRRPRSHEVERLIKELYGRNDCDRAGLANLEWICIPLISILDRPHYSLTLQEELAAEPTFFVNFLEILYKEENDDTPPAPITEETHLRANQAVLTQYLLDGWRKIPGSNKEGAIDASKLKVWVDKTRSLASKKLRLKVADLQIGKVLTYYLRTKPIEMPPDAICSVIDQVNTPAIISGFRTELFNQFGMSSRGVFVGGDREWSIYDQYKKIAESLLLKWPITASIFDDLARSYQYDAVQQDEQAQKHSLDS